jgi:hypothetical protein
LATEYFPCLFRLEGADYYVIGYSDERDGLLRESGRLLVFQSLTELHAYALQRGVAIQPTEVAKYDWDAIERWCDRPLANGIAVGPFLNAWNMVVDTLPAFGEPRLFSHADARNGAVYEKLFRANNLPAMTPPGAEYYPVWIRAEVEALATVLRLVVTEVRRQVESRLTGRLSGPA